jgi:hypothetical protein
MMGVRSERSERRDRREGHQKMRREISPRYFFHPITIHHGKHISNTKYYR